MLNAGGASHMSFYDNLCDAKRHFESSKNGLKVQLCKLIEIGPQLNEEDVLISISKAVSDLKEYYLLLVE